MGGECKHGLPSDSPEYPLKVGLLFQVFQEFKAIINEKDGFKDALEHFLEFWSTRPHLVDKDLCKIYFAQAAQALLQDGGKDPVATASHAEMLWQGIMIQAMVEVGVDKFMKQMNYDGTPSPKATNLIKMTQSHFGMVKFLQTVLPCSCLNELEMTTSGCWSCFKDVNKADLLPCHLCMEVTYCSPNCQLVAFSNHLLVCSKRMAIEQYRASQAENKGKESSVEGSHNEMQAKNKGSESSVEGKQDQTQGKRKGIESSIKENQDQTQVKCKGNESSCEGTQEQTHVKRKGNESFIKGTHQQTKNYALLLYVSAAVAVLGILLAYWLA